MAKLNSVDDARHAAVKRRTGAGAVAALLLGGALCLFPGCSGDHAALLGSYLDEVEFDAPHDSAATISLGTFDIPASTTVKIAGATRTIWMRIKFELFAETTPEHESAVQQAYDRRRGALNDAVLTIVRTSSTDELTDPRSSALKMRITEAVRPLLGAENVRQVVLYGHTTEKL